MPVERTRAHLRMRTNLSIRFSFKNQARSCADGRR